MELDIPMLLAGYNDMKTSKGMTVRMQMDGTPKEIFARVDELREYHLTVPEVTELAEKLRKEGLPIPGGILSVDEFVEAVCGLN